MSIVFSIVLVTIFGAPTDAPSTENSIREVIQRSIPYIEKQGTNWIETKECVSCHRVNTMVWSLREAGKHGFDVSDELGQWQDWAIESSLSENDEGVIVGTRNQEGVAQLILSLGNEPASAESRQNLMELLKEGQQPSGSWKPDGQLPTQKRPKPETEAVSTMWIASAFLDSATDKQPAPIVDRAIEYITQSKPGKSTEWYTVRLLLAVQQGDENSRDRLIQDLRSQQREDGGWGWIVGDTSDALGTGMAMHALRSAGVSRSDQSITRAQSFLIDTQGDDGSWKVRGTKANTRDHVEETASYWGTTWAVLGLIASLPESN